MNEGRHGMQTELLDHERAITFLEPLDKIQKQIAGAQGFAVFIAVVNFALGAAIIWIPPIAQYFDIISGIGYVLFGLVYFGLAVGIGRKSRIATTAGFVLIVLDTLYSFVIRIMQSDSAGRFSIMRLMLLGALFMGMVASFRFHKLKKENMSTGEEATQELFARKPFIVSKKQFVLFVVFVVASGITLAKGVLAPFPVPGVESWEIYNFSDAGISMKAPGEMEPNVDHSPPDILSYECQEDNVYLNMIMLRGVADRIMGDETVAEGLARQMLNESITHPLEDVSELGGEGKFDGAPYYQVAGYNKENGVVAVGRVYSSRGNLYYTVMVMFGKPDSKQVRKAVDGFFSSIETIS